MIHKLFSFNGGVKPDTNKTQSVTEPIAVAPLFREYVVPLHQHIGGTPRPLVAAGDKVLKGQRIGEADGRISAAVHAPTSGTVLAVEERVVPHPSGLPSACVVIEADGEDRWCERTPLDWRNTSPDEVRDHLRDAGIVGMGGAVFPSYAKLTPSRNTPTEELVINGAECEPYITCDDMLMRERAEEVLRGALIMRELMQAKRILVGIEDNKPEAVAAMRDAAQRIAPEAPVEVIAVPTRYPAGGAKQLIRVLTGKEVPSDKRSTDLGVQCFNVATAAAVYRALELGEPLVSRLLTVTGHANKPRNWEVPIGAPMNEVIKLAEPKEGMTGIVMGGPMMGFNLPRLDVPVVKATNCLIAAHPSLFPPAPPEMPCIRCTRCAEACPHELQPFELYWFARAKNFGKAQEYDLFDCIECGCCSFVCPSDIPLVQYFRFAKSEIWAREREKNASDTARERFESRNARIEREKKEKAERLAKHKAPAAVPAGDADAAAKAAAVAAAVERAKAQRETVQPANTDNLSRVKQAEIAIIDAQREAAGITPESDKS